MAEEAGIEPAKAFSAYIGFEDQGSHQTPSASEDVLHYHHHTLRCLFRFAAI